MPTDPQERLTKYLTDAHSFEEQALAQLRTAPGIAGEPELAEAYRTPRRDRDARGADPRAGPGSTARSRQRRGS